jgi:Leucine-rich repeat (LRR) protein
MQELSLAGNMLRELPEELGGLTSLRKLQLSGNRLKALPDSLCGLSQLEVIVFLAAQLPSLKTVAHNHATTFPQGLWIHGNLLKHLPADFGALGALRTMSAVGNHLEALPESLGALQQLRELELAGNRLRGLPATLGALGALQKLTLNGNALGQLPDALGGLTALSTLALQANELTHLPASIASMAQLKELNLADNRLAALPEGGLPPALHALWLYGNELSRLPRSILAIPTLRGACDSDGAVSAAMTCMLRRVACAVDAELWAEANPLGAECVAGLVAALARLPPERKLVVGLDTAQAAHVDAESIEAAGKRLQVAEIAGAGRGYFKLSRAPGCETSSEGRALVVSFASAPGVPNWGGLLPRVRKAATSPEQEAFDILYVVDPERAWYNGALGFPWFQYLIIFTYISSSIHLFRC